MALTKNDEKKRVPVDASYAMPFGLSPVGVITLVMAVDVSSADVTI